MGDCSLLQNDLTMIEYNSIIQNMKRGINMINANNVVSQLNNRHHVWMNITHTY